MMSLLFISFASADVSIGQVSKGGTTQLTQTCSNCTYVNLTSVLYPNNTYALLGQFTMTKNGSNFNRTWSDTNTLGNYIYTTCGDLNGVNTCQSVGFEVTYRGEVLTTSNSILYSILMFVLIFVFILTLLGIGKLPQENIRGDDQRIFKLSYLKYLTYALWLFEWGLLIAIFYMSSNLSYAYFGNQLFADFFLMLFRLCLWLTLPIVIIWFLWIFARIVEDKELFRMIEHGFVLDGGKSL